jgi:hypothetical protein
MAESLPISNIINIIKTDICGRCGIEQPIENFKKSKNCKVGYQKTCKQCMNLLNKDWAKNNPEKVKKANSNWEKGNRDKRNILQRKYREQKKQKKKDYLIANGLVRDTADGRLCSTCNIRMPIENFAKSNSKDGHFASCKKCRYTATKKFLDVDRKERPDFYKKRSWESHLKNSYNLTQESVDALLQSQGCKCAICRKTIGHDRSDTHIDHCHSTGKVRGILCRKCNHGLGKFEDNVDKLYAAIEYLNRANGKT